MVNCCVVGCDNQSDKKPELKFHNIPNRPYEKERRKRWFAAINRKNPDGTLWQPTSSSARVCSEHFVGGKISNIANHPSYVPSIFPEKYKKKEINERTALLRYERSRRRSRCEPIASVQQDLLNLQLAEPLQTTDDFHTHTTSVSTQSCRTMGGGVQFVAGQGKGWMGIAPTLMGVNFEYHAATTQFEFVATRETDGFSTYCCISESMVLPTTQKKDAGCGTENDLQVCKGGFHGFDSVCEREELLQNLTTTSLETFSFLLSIITRNAFRALSDSDALLLFLMKMKLGLSFSCLGVLFNVHRSTAMRVFITMLQTLSVKTANFIFWPSKYCVSATLPNAFKKDYFNTRVIIDCTEMKTEMPSNIDERVYMYSHYKSAYTFKFLIGVTPNGLISFKSKCYGGRTSDSQITNDCGLLQLLEKGDVVLADKGFPGVHFTDSDTIIIMPPVLHDGRHTAEEVARTQSIAGVRIHVERCIQRVKIFKITHFITHDLFKYIDNIVHVACVLANLMPPIFQNEDQFFL